MFALYFIFLSIFPPFFLAFRFKMYSQAIKNKIVFALVLGLLASVNDVESKRESCRTRKLKLTIKESGCTEKRVETVGCYGRCLSVALPSLKATNGFLSTCSCCAPVVHRTKRIVLNCFPKYKTYNLPVAKKCLCRPC